jgi:membrane-associated protease RseP (regulator of RpoE activity)
MKKLGIGILLIGVLCALVAIFMDTTVPTAGGRVHNLGLIQRQNTFLVLGAVSVLVGVLMFAISKVGARTSGITPADLQAVISNRGKTGIMLNSKDGRTIVNTVGGSPAYIAGIKPGDRITMINDVICTGSYDQVVMQLIGDPGTQVNVTVRRGSHALNFQLTRI